MPSASEYNQFRRLIGDFKTQTMDETEIDSWLNDACRELTADFVNAARVSTPVTVFDTLVAQYHPEVILKAAINYWWMKAAEYTDKQSQSMGTASVNLSEKFDRAMQMITALQTQYDTIQELQTDITIGHISRWSKNSMRRIGGRSEEDILQDDRP